MQEIKRVLYLVVVLSSLVVAQIATACGEGFWKEAYETYIPVATLPQACKEKIEKKEVENIQPNREELTVINSVKRLSLDKNDTKPVRPFVLSVDLEDFSIEVVLRSKKNRQTGSLESLEAIKKYFQSK